MLENLKGKLIVICGTDGSGKGTQTEILVKRLLEEGCSVKKTDFPQYEKQSSFMVKEYLNGKFGTAKDVGPYTASVFYAIDRYYASFEMKEWLDKGEVIVSNRYVSANLGHQGGKINDKSEREKYVLWLRDFEYNIMGIPKPDINIFLHVPAEVSQELVDKKEKREYTDKKRDIHEADINHLRDSESAYLQVCKSDNSWVRIDCMKNGKLASIEEIGELIWQSIEKFFEKERK